MKSVCVKNTGGMARKTTPRHAQRARLVPVVLRALPTQNHRGVGSRAAARVCPHETTQPWPKV
eukprot:3525631-Lingulodinium_polyedra.AAC.1